MRGVRGHERGNREGFIRDWPEYSARGCELPLRHAVSCNGDTGLDNHR